MKLIIDQDNDLTKKDNTIVNKAKNLLEGYLAGIKSLFPGMNKKYNESEIKIILHKREGDYYGQTMAGSLNEETLDVDIYDLVRNVQDDNLKKIFAEEMFHWLQHADPDFNQYLLDCKKNNKIKTSLGALFQFILTRQTDPEHLATKAFVSYIVDGDSNSDWISFIKKYYE